MFEISSHKVILAKSSNSVLDDTVTQRAGIWGFASTTGYSVIPHSRLLGSVHVIEIFKKISAEDMCEILLIILPPICKTGSQSCET